MDKITDGYLRGVWIAAGGTFYGPKVETGAMPESELLPFLRRMTEIARAADELDALIGGTELFSISQADVQAAKSIVGVKRKIQDLVHAIRA